MDTIRDKACPNPACTDADMLGAGNIIVHASFNTKTGARQRWRCTTCGRTFSSNTGTTYAGLQCSRGEFDQVATMPSDGFEFYEEVVRRVLGVAAVYGQVIKTRRNNHVIRVERAAKIGTKCQLAAPTWSPRIRRS